MASIDLKELYALIKASPDYKARFFQDVAPEEALYIKFGEPKQKPLQTETFTTSEGSYVVLDVDDDGIVWGMEIA